MWQSSTFVVHFPICAPERTTAKSGVCNRDQLLGSSDRTKRNVVVLLVAQGAYISHPPTTI